MAVIEEEEVSRRRCRRERASGGEVRLDETTGEGQETLWSGEDVEAIGWTGEGESWEGISKEEGGGGSRKDRATRAAPSVDARPRPSRPESSIRF